VCVCVCVWLKPVVVKICKFYFNVKRLYVTLITGMPTGGYMVKKHLVLLMRRALIVMLYWHQTGAKLVVYHDRCEWLNVSSGTGSPGLSGTKSREL